MEIFPLYCTIALGALGSSAAPCLGIFIAIILHFLFSAQLFMCVLANVMCFMYADYDIYAALWAKHISRRH